MISLADAILFFKGDSKSLDDTTKRVEDNTMSTFDKMMGKSRQVGLAFTAMGGVITGTFGAMIKSFADQGDALDEMSDRTGISVEELSRLDFAAKQNGTSIEGLEGSFRKAIVTIDKANQATIKARENMGEKSAKEYEKSQRALNTLSSRYDIAAEKLNVMRASGKASTEQIANQELKLKEMALQLQDATAKMGSAADAMSGMDQETVDATKAFERLGLNFDELAKMKPDEKVDALMRALAGVSDKGDQAALAVQVFGKQGSMMLPMLANGYEGLKKFKDEADALGITLSTKDAEAAAEFNDALGRLQGVARGTGFTIARILIPAAMSFLQWTEKTVMGVKAWVDEHPKLTEALIKLTAAVGGFMVVSGPFFIALPGIVTAFKLLGGAGGLLGLTSVGFTALAAPILVVAGAILVLTPLIHANIQAHRDLREALDQEAETHERLSGKVMEYIEWLEARGAVVDRSALAEMTMTEALAALHAKHDEIRGTALYVEMQQLKMKEKAEEEASYASMAAISQEVEKRKQASAQTEKALEGVTEAQWAAADETKSVADANIKAQQAYQRDLSREYDSLKMMTGQQVGSIHEIMKGLSPATRHSPSINDLVFAGFAELENGMQGVYARLQSVGNMISGVFSGIQDAISFALSLGGMPGMGGGDATPRAYGGPVEAGRIYNIEEITPEVFIPKMSGDIIPLPQAAKLMSSGGMGGGVSVQVHGPLVVREEADVEKIARRLYDMTVRRR